MVKERNVKKGSDILNGFDRDSFAQIYLFFDYDGQVPTASDENLEDMLKLFDNETENGKLFISYPMVEALKHFLRATSFEACVVPANIVGRTYKPLVNNSSRFRNITIISKANWKYIIEENEKKANLIVNGCYSRSGELIEQISIWEGQLNQYKMPHNQIAVLSAFPFFLLEYFGYEFTDSQVFL